MSDVIVRPAAPDEAADLFRLIADNLETGHLLPRPLGEVVLHVPMFLVAAEPTGVVGCAEMARLGFEARRGAVHWSSPPPIAATGWARSC